MFQKCDTPSSKDEEGDENIHDASQDSGANSNQSSSDDSSDSGECLFMSRFSFLVMYTCNCDQTAVVLHTFVSVW